MTMSSLLRAWVLWIVANFGWASKIMWIGYRAIAICFIISRVTIAMNYVIISFINQLNVCVRAICIAISFMIIP